VQEQTLGEVGILSHLMAICLRYIHIKNYKNLIILSKVTTESFGDVFY